MDDENSKPIRLIDKIVFIGFFCMPFLMLFFLALDADEKASRFIGRCLDYVFDYLLK